MCNDKATQGGETLNSLLMKTGPLSTLLPHDNTWKTVAAKLQSTYAGIVNTKNDVAYLCATYYAYDKTNRARYPAQIRYVNGKKETNTDLIDEVSRFLETFMEANGQWAYIQKQDWFTSGDYVIGIDLNYYPDRSKFTESSAFHKDTGGNNIFVNLVFDNQTDIVATEWFADTERPGTLRAAWQKGLLPKTHLEALEAARDIRREEERKAKVAGDPNHVVGGVSTGVDTYVSWVDDLVWHATPSPKLRFVYTAEAAERAYDTLNSPNGDFTYDDQELGVVVQGRELVGTMAEVEGTHLHNWLTTKRLKVQDIAGAVADDAWYALYGVQGGKEAFLKDAAVRAATPWRITGQESEAIAYDDRLGESATSIKETPVGLSGRRRADSLPANEEALKRARDASAGKPRSFIRTWVRILPKNSPELSDAKVVFT